VGNHRRRKWAGCYSQSPGDEPDLIILDLAMPVMDGLAAARAISKLLPEIPMLMHTMHWSLQVEVEAQESACEKSCRRRTAYSSFSTVRQFLPPDPSAPATIPFHPLTADVATPVAIGESGSVATADDTDAPAASGTEDLLKNGHST
jgi:CheY-like chemotaxis protein